MSLLRDGFAFRSACSFCCSFLTCCLVGCSSLVAEFSKTMIFISNLSSRAWSNSFVLEALFVANPQAPHSKATKARGFRTLLDILEPQIVRISVSKRVKIVVKELVHVSCSMEHRLARNELMSTQSKTVRRELIHPLSSSCKQNVCGESESMLPRESAGQY